MRTTLTLEPDVAERLRKEIASGRITLKQAINERLRIGFGMHSVKKRARFRVEPHDSPYCPGVDRAKLNQLVDDLEADLFRSSRP